MNVYHRLHRFDDRVKEAKKHMSDNKNEMKTVSAWAKEYGLQERSARNWFKRLGYNDNGSLKIGTRVGKQIRLTESEWRFLRLSGPEKPGIKKGFKYSEEALKSRSVIGE